MVLFSYNIKQMMHLSIMLAEPVDQTRSALEALSLSQKTINSLDVEGMMSTSVKASEAMDSLSDNKELVNTFEVPLSGLCFCRK
ncbi:hypothetical protein C5167_017671 [Papaver somniferum]|uniref:Uncharacterized protein n=1 Tax=Papaver somniferum TaxID=3469 RepID=A0A4Y7IP28_PAPSO|nr:hypothetical protein C5167_017671 [Papaver somniferum]